jgi:hypothetical protein
VTVAGAASALGAVLGTRIWPVVQREREARLELARQVLGEVRFAELWAAGQVMPRDRAVAYALGGESPV